MGNSIYSRIPEHRLEDILQTLQAYTQIPVRLIQADGDLLQAFGPEAGFCALLKKTAMTGAACLELQVMAGRRAQELGEAYIFSCSGNLNHIAFPLIVGDILLGSVILGPFLMDTPDSTLIVGLAERHGLSPTQSLELYDELTGLQVVTPPRVQLLKKLLEHLLSPLLAMERTELLQRQEKLYQQSRINETIQYYKGQEARVSEEYFHQKERELLSRVRSASAREVKGLLNDLLGYVLFIEGASLEAMRIRAVELTTLLSRVAMDGGAQERIIYELNNKLLPAMFREQNLDELCLLLQDVAETFMDAMFSGRDKGNPHIRRALRYVAGHYGENLELGTVAEYVGLSPSYFSALFHSVTGVSFREHLARVRVEAGKQLLLSTDYSLGDIAVAVGFSDQSYFCKVFKRVVGIPPGKFRS